MTRLLCNDEVVAELEIADRARTRAVGLLGRRSIDGALLITQTSSVHTIGMRFAIDVAFVDAGYRVVKVQTLRPNRMTRFVPGATHVVESAAGAMAGWGVDVGSVLRPSTCRAESSRR